MYPLVTMMLLDAASWHNSAANTHLQGNIDVKRIGKPDEAKRFPLPPYFKGALQENVPENSKVCPKFDNTLIVSKSIESSLQVPAQSRIFEDLMIH